MVDDEIGEKAHDREVDLCECDKEANDADHHRIGCKDLDDDQAHGLGVRNVDGLVVLYGVGDEWHNAITGKGGDARADESVESNDPPFSPIINRNAKQFSVVIRAKL